MPLAQHILNVLEILLVTFFQWRAGRHRQLECITESFARNPHAVNIRRPAVARRQHQRVSAAAQIGKLGADDSGQERPHRLFTIDNSLNHILSRARLNESSKPLWLLCFFLLFSPLVQIALQPADRLRIFRSIPAQQPDHHINIAYPAQPVAQFFQISFRFVQGLAVRMGFQQLDNRIQSSSGDSDTMDGERLRFSECEGQQLRKIIEKTFHICR